VFSKFWNCPSRENTSELILNFTRNHTITGHSSERRALTLLLNLYKPKVFLHVLKWFPLHCSNLTFSTCAIPYTSRLAQQSLSERFTSCYLLLYCYYYYFVSCDKCRWKRMLTYITLSGPPLKFTGSLHNIGLDLTIELCHEHYLYVLRSY
jgi:hypothetical protein